MINAVNDILSDLSGKYGDKYQPESLKLREKQFYLLANTGISSIKSVDARVLRSKIPVSIFIYKKT